MIASSQQPRSKQGSHFLQVTHSRAPRRRRRRRRRRSGGAWQRREEKASEGIRRQRNWVPGTMLSLCATASLVPSGENSMVRTAYVRAAFAHEIESRNAEHRRICAGAYFASHILVHDPSPLTGHKKALSAGFVLNLSCFSPCSSKS